MVRVIEREEDAAGAPRVVFHVYAKCSDRAVVLGAVLFGAPQDERAYRWQASELGTPVAEAFQKALAYADMHGVPYLQVDDPHRLFPPERRKPAARAARRPAVIRAAARVAQLRRKARRRRARPRAPD